MVETDSRVPVHNPHTFIDFNAKTSRLIRVFANFFQSKATKMDWILSVGTYLHILVPFCSTFDGTNVFQIFLNIPLSKMHVNNIHV